jgi:LPS export ABC transporter protein LptC/lipopolysaccharide transport protein LptA
MKIRDLKSIIIIFLYSAFNLGIILVGVTTKPTKNEGTLLAHGLAPEFTEISKLEYFHLKGSNPQMSLSAEHMKSQNEEFAEFNLPKGIYNYQEKNKLIHYQADQGIYQKNRELLILSDNVKVHSEESDYQADHLKYYFKKDVIVGKGNVKFEGDDPKSKDFISIQSDFMRAKPQAQVSRFKGHVQGSMQRKRKYEGKMTFSSSEFEFDGNKSLANLTGGVHLKRDNYDITAGKGDIYLENYNKKLKYFVLNDDVKVLEKLQTKEGYQERKAYAERLEGFGSDQKMVLTGAPRVEMGKDIIKGYRITIRENIDLVEVDDAMSDVQVKRPKD